MESADPTRFEKMGYKSLRNEVLKAIKNGGPTPG